MNIQIVKAQEVMRGTRVENRFDKKIIDITGYTTDVLTNQRAIELFLELTFASPSCWIHLNSDMLPKDFFKLSSQLCGDLFQKCQNYGIKLIISADFQKYDSKALHDFKYETNKQGNFLLVSNIEEALALITLLSKKGE